MAREENGTLSEVVSLASESVPVLSLARHVLCRQIAARCVILDIEWIQCDVAIVLF